MDPLRDIRMKSLTESQPIIRPNNRRRSIQEKDNIIDVEIIA